MLHKFMTRPSGNVQEWGFNIERQSRFTDLSHWRQLTQSHKNSMDPSQKLAHLSGAHTSQHCPSGDHVFI